MPFQGKGSSPGYTSPLALFMNSEAQCSFSKLNLRFHALFFSSVAEFQMSPQNWPPKAYAVAHVAVPRRQRAGLRPRCSNYGGPPTDLDAGQVSGRRGR